MNHIAELKTHFHLQKHPEGGWFSEVFQSVFQNSGRASAGSIYFLLDSTDISHFHIIDCDEIWYYHEGCGMNLILLEKDGTLQIEKLGMCLEKGESPMVVIHAGTCFAAENTDQKGYTFVSCATTPKFSYDGFHLCTEKELLSEYPQHETIIRKFCIPQNK